MKTVEDRRDRRLRWQSWRSPLEKRLDIVVYSIWKGCADFLTLINAAWIALFMLLLIAIIRVIGSR